MPFLLAIFLFAIWFMMNAGQSAHRNRRIQSCEMNDIAGYIEYTLSWHIFHDELIPEVYRQALDRGLHDIGIYDQEFDDIGTELYGHTPIEEATVRSKKIMVEHGRTPYVGAWRWDESKNDISDFSKDEMALPLSQRGMDFRWRVDLVFDNPPIMTTEEFDRQLKSDPLLKIPANDDMRRNYYKRAGSYLWRPKENVLVDNPMYKWAPRKRLGHPIYDPDEFIQDSIRWP